MFSSLSLRSRVILAAISGLSSWSLYFVHIYLHYVLTGGIFGAFVLIPHIRSKPHRAYRAVGLVVASVLIYWVAVRLAVEQYGPLDLDYEIATVVSGIVGALLVTVATKFIAPLSVSWKLWVYSAISGLIGGLVLDFQGVPSPGLYQDLLAVLGYVIWQVLVCLALYFGRLEQMTSNCALGVPDR